MVTIVNYCIEKRYFPDSSKLAHIIPLPKVKIPSDYKDLHPISILPILCKLLEKVLNMQIQNHFEGNNVLPDIQSGFRPNHGCGAALLKVVDDILSARDITFIIHHPTVLKPFIGWEDTIYDYTLTPIYFYNYKS